MRIRPCTCSAGSWNISQICPETAFVAHVKIAMRWRTRWRTSARQYETLKRRLHILYLNSYTTGMVKKGSRVAWSSYKQLQCVYTSSFRSFTPSFSNSNHPWITRGDNKGGKLLTGTPFAASWASKHVFTIIRFDGHGIEPWESRGASSESVTTTQKSLPLFTWMFEGVIPSWIQHCIVFARVYPY